MAANEALNALSTTDASNTPAGGDTIGATLDDELRSIKANIARAGRWEVTATVTAAATLTETVLHKVVPVDGSAGGTTTITLPTAGSAGTGFATMLLKVGAANNAIVDGSGAETIDGAANYTLTEQYESVVLVCDGAQWFATSRGNRKTMPALSVDGASTLSGAVTMKTSLTNTGPTTLDGSLTMSATALFALPVTLAGAVTVTGDADFQGAFNCGTLTASATAVFKSDVIIDGDLGVSGTASVGALVVGGSAYVEPVLLQQVTASSSFYHSGATTTPADDTVPTSSEGNLILMGAVDPDVPTTTASATAMQVSITANNASNIIRIQALVNFAPATTSYHALALFKDNSTAASTVVFYAPSGANFGTPMQLDYSEAAGDTSAHTWKLRLGPGAAGTIYFNGGTAGRLYGGVMRSSIFATEVKV